MTNITAGQAKPRKYQGPVESQHLWPLSANFYAVCGAAVMFDASTGLIANCTPTASGKFAGFINDDVDNRTGSVPNGGAAGAASAMVERKGNVWLDVAHTGTYALTDVGATVYASDNDTFTLSAGTNNIVIGKLAFVPADVVDDATGLVLVRFEGTVERSI